eukprot:3389400-Rhodomonas_salina.3
MQPMKAVRALPAGACSTPRPLASARPPLRLGPASPVSEPGVAKRAPNMEDGDLGFYRRRPSGWPPRAASQPSVAQSV